VIDHKDGIEWHQAPLPRRQHRCRPQSWGFLSTGSYVERCACGAVNLNHSGWIRRNERRKVNDG